MYCVNFPLYGTYICTYRIVGNFRGTKFSQMAGSKNENSQIKFSRMLHGHSHVIEQQEHLIHRFYFCGCQAKRKIRENFVPREFPAIRYTEYRTDSWQ